MTTAAAHARYPLTQGVNPWLVTVSVMLPTFMEVLDTAIASVALPYIAGSLSASNSEATWVLTSYLVANAVILPASNWFARRFGRKRFLLTCVILFTIASFFCGAAPSLAVILAGPRPAGRRRRRIAAASRNPSCSKAFRSESAPCPWPPTAWASWCAPVLGPTLGGWLTDTFSWRYAFYINIPVGILAVIMISRFVHDPPYIKNAKVGAFDNIGFGLLIVWTGCLQIVLDKGQEDDWFGAIWVRWAVAALVVAFLLWVWRSWTNPKGLVDLHILKDRNFRTGCFMIAMLGMCIYITIAILPLYYQEILGYTAFTAGLVVGPRGIGSFIGSPVIGFLGSRIDNRKLLCAGFLGFAVCSFIFGTVNLDIGPYTLLIPIMLTGFALSFVFVPLATMTTLHHLPQRDGQRHRPLQHAAQHRRIDRHRHGHHRAHPPRRSPPDRPRAAISPRPPPRCSRNPPCIAALSRPSHRPGQRAPRLLRPDLRPHAAAGRPAGLCRCLPLDRCAGLDLRRRTWLFKKPAEHATPRRRARTEEPVPAVIAGLGEPSSQGASILQSFRQQLALQIDPELNWTNTRNGGDNSSMRAVNTLSARIGGAIGIAPIRMPQLSFSSKTRTNWMPSSLAASTGRQTRRFCTPAHRRAIGAELDMQQSQFPISVGLQAVALFRDDSLLPATKGPARPIRFVPVFPTKILVNSSVTNLIS